MRIDRLWVTIGLLTANLLVLVILLFRVGALDRRAEEIDDVLFFVENQTRYNQFLIFDAIERVETKRDN